MRHYFWLDLSKCQFLIGKVQPANICGEENDEEVIDLMCQFLIGKVQHATDYLYERFSDKWYPDCVNSS